MSDPYRSPQSMVSESGMDVDVALAKAKRAKIAGILGVTMTFFCSFLGLPASFLGAVWGWQLHEAIKLDPDLDPAHNDAMVGLGTGIAGCIMGGLGLIAVIAVLAFL